MRTALRLLGPLALVALTFGAPTARADFVTDANARANDIVVSGRLPAPVAVRTMAIVQVSVHDALAAIDRRGPALRARMDAASGASQPAAVAAATRTILLKAVPNQQAAIDAAYEEATRAVPRDAAFERGVAVGERAATMVWEGCATDGASAPDTYRPYTTAGLYVPTQATATPHWGSRMPWTMTRADQFRPGPPPALTSAQWARDYNEIKALGARSNSRRTPEQTDIARFWEATGAAIYFPLVRAVADASHRDPVDNARLLAVAGMAMDDALIAVFDAKYTYNFWRPVTAIRNGDIDGNDATERDAGWLPYIDTPMHPEYPCAHCIVAASVGAVIEAALGERTGVKLATTSVTAPGVTRSWERVDDFVTEVAMARIYDGVHYRTSTEVARSMGKAIGRQAVERYLAPPV